jgi:hypothetical protein
VIASITSVAVACAAKAATMSIPIVFEVAGEPAEAGLVKSLTEPEAQSHGHGSRWTAASRSGSGFENPEVYQRCFRSTAAE